MCGKTENSKVVPFEDDVLIQMFTPLRSFNSLVPNNLDVQWKIQFTDDDRYFVTTTSGAKPTFQITGSVTSAAVLPLPSLFTSARAPSPNPSHMTETSRDLRLITSQIVQCTSFVACFDRKLNSRYKDVSQPGRFRFLSWEIP